MPMQWIKNKSALKQDRPVRAARLASFTLVLLASATLPAQTARAPISDYIHNSWDSLGRSMTECKSVVDTKVATTPILYLPAGMATPASVAAMQKQCTVEVKQLPRVIHKMGDVRVSEIPKEGLLYLPNRYVVPGGRFNEMYGWDSYFIILGLISDGRVPIAKGMVENFFFEIENYGAILNANRTYYFTRSQPPLLSSMIREVYDKTQDKAWLAGAYAYGARDYSLWSHAPHLAGATGLSRYSDLGAGPVPEMADDNTYYPDVIRALLAHPGTGDKYLVPASEHPNAKEMDALASTSCDLRASKVCAAAYASGHRLTAAYFRGDRAMRESGFDTSFRFGPYSGSTDEFAPVCLNSLLYKYETDMAYFAMQLGKPAEEKSWNQRAEARKTAINKYLWHADTGSFYDWNFVRNQASTYNFLSAYYPLWAGLATPAQAASEAGHLDLFEHEGGVALSDNQSGVQWDAPFGWAPTTYFTTAGLHRYKFDEQAGRIAGEFRRAVETYYLSDGTIREKYNVASPSANVAVAAGYKTNVIGFGWTNGVYVRLGELTGAGSAPVASAASPALPEGIIRDQSALEHLIPTSVFFRGQSATVQLRNSAAIRFADGTIMFVAKVDTGGYATSLQEKYQNYLVTEDALQIGGPEGKVLPPGAYGTGFTSDGFLVMDLGGHTIFTTPAKNDRELRRPGPLQITGAGTAYRLYSGRTYVEVSRAAQDR